MPLKKLIMVKLGQAITANFKGVKFNGYSGISYVKPLVGELTFKAGILVLVC